MNFAKWLKAQEPGVRAKMRRALGKHGGALDRAQRGQPVSFANAEKICAMTLGEVTLGELCKPGAKPKRPAKARGRAWLGGDGGAP